MGKQLVEEKRAAVLAASDDGSSVEKKTVAGRDLLTVLSKYAISVVCRILVALLRYFAFTVKANLAGDVKESERMSEQEVIDRTSQQRTDHLGSALTP